ncbi:importin beta-like SAD2 homolog [Malania oleifera]|uniref:importin beta-like SAD2 homolog n=1 Tax=Malania oleifera TaxID=397392 RepID=UPI0025AE9B12|nr:importin beta-like SAD2 homolog [Malania oleifera]
MESTQIALLLDETLSSEGDVVRSATEALDRLSLLPQFPFSLLSIATGGESRGQKVAAAAYLKNLTRRNVDGDGQFSRVSKEFRDQLMRAMLQAEPVVLKVLIEAFRVIVSAQFVKDNSWPELVPELRTVIENSNLIRNGVPCEWKTVNALSVLHALIRPFQYFVNPGVAREPVPPQLELIAREILVPLLAVFHHFVEKAIPIHGRTETETERVLLLVCKCIYFSVRSHMPSALAPLLPSFCRDLFGILGSLSFDNMPTLEDGYILRLKTGKRSLLVFRALVTRHRKNSDKLMPDFINCVLRVVKNSANISKKDATSERIISLAFDLVSHVLETGPGWRLVSPHFSSLLDSAIFPALVMSKKDISDWEEDPDEYIQKNLPSDLGEISGWREDLFTARKSAINLLGVISVSRGPPVVALSNGSSSKRKKGERNRGKGQRSSMGELLVVPFLSKFPIPSDANVSETKILNDYYGVLMAYGSLQDFLRDQKPGYITTLIRARVLPVFALSVYSPYLVATANWILGELASCLPEDLSADIYSSLLKALAMPDMGDISCYPVHSSAAGAIATLLENDYLPPEWSPLLQVLVGRIGREDEETSIIFQLLSTVVEVGNENVAVHIPCIVSAVIDALLKCLAPNLDPTSQMVERGFATLAAMAHSWEDSMPEEVEESESSEMWISGQATIARGFSYLLQQAWLLPSQSVEGEVLRSSPPSSCLDDCSTLLWFIVQSVTESNMMLELKLSELLLVWADAIADWHAWEEVEDLSIFKCISEVVHLHKRFGLKNLFVRGMPSPPAPPVPQGSIIEGIGAFVSEAISQYPSATWRASSCVHILLHVPNYSLEAEGVKQSLVTAFSLAAFSHFKDIQSKPCSLWKPLLLVISSCYLCYPDIVERILEKHEHNGFSVWASALGFISTKAFRPGLLVESEIKLTVMALAKVVERLSELGNPGGRLIQDCFTSLMETCMRLKEVQKEEEEDYGEEAEDDDDDDDTSDDEIDDDEDSEDDVREETEEEFLNRYAEVAANLENGFDVEEEDVEDVDQELELGGLKDVDQRSILQPLMERCHQVLIKGQPFPPQLVSSFLSTFPEYTLFFERPL